MKLSKVGVALSPPRRFRAAIVGTGSIAEIAHLPALRTQAHRVDVVAAVDVDPGRLGEFTRKHAIPAGYESLAAMLAEQHPDLGGAVARWPGIGGTAHGATSGRAAARRHRPSVARGGPGAARPTAARAEVRDVRTAGYV